LPPAGPRVVHGDWEQDGGRIVCIRARREPGPNLGRGRRRRAGRGPVAVHPSGHVGQPDRVRAPELMPATGRSTGKRSERPLAGRAGERGQIMLALLLAAILITVISVSLVGIMNTDLSHASIQYAVARSYYIAQAGLEEARAHVFAAADPAADATPAAGMTVSYGGGGFPYWFDGGPATGWEPGPKRLEGVGHAPARGRRCPTPLPACAARGAT